MDTEPDLIVLGDPAGDRETVGGKAAVLGALAADGYRVPPGFVVTASAVDGLGSRLDATLTAAAGRFSPGPFAVRSSAVAEDLPETSYAGLYETFLNVPGDGIAESVRNCLASSTDQRVSAYQDAHSPDAHHPGSEDLPRPTGMAVLVQQMVPAAAAGVAFTANPMTGDRGEVVVTAVRGLGERLVSGVATGEEWTIRGDQATRTRPGEQALTAAQAREIAGLARGLATRFGVPQDVEWAIDHHQQLFLLQTRPMTALPGPVDWAPPGPGLWVRNFRLGEWLPEPMTPLFADWLVPVMEDGYLGGMRATAGVTVPFRYAAVNGWYYNATPIPSARLLLRVVRDSRGRAPWFLYHALVRVSRNPAAADRAVLSRLDRQWRDQLLPTYRATVDTAAREVEEASPQRLLAVIDGVCRLAGQYLWFLAVVGGSAWKMEGALTRFWNRHLAEPLAGTTALEAGPQALLRGLPGAEPVLPSHAVHSLDWYHPTVGETATAMTVPAAGRSGLATTRTAIEAVCRAALHDRRKLLPRFDELLGVAQRYVVIREEQARDLSLGWPLLRRCAHRLGEHLVAIGGIAAVDDIFFLNRAELTAALDGAHERLTQVASERRARWEHQRRLAAPLRLGQPPRVIGDPIARAVEAARSSRDLPEDAIIGHPASAGRATGKVRVIQGPADFASFAEGEVLVARATAPAWTPLFARAAAVVTDGGTLAAHASLVAREYGIPAVVGTGVATARLRTGQVVTVDGSAGAVQPADFW